MIWSSGKNGVVAGGVVAEDGFGSRSGVHAEELSANRDATIGADFNVGAEAPDKRPPGANGFGTQDGAFFFEGEVPGFLGDHFDFAVDLVVIAMKAQRLDVRISVVEIGDVLAGEVSGQSLLPEEMDAFDFAFGLGCRGVAETDAVEVKSLAQL